MTPPVVLSLPEIPDAFLEALARLARERFGRAAPEGRVLGAAVSHVSRKYTRDRAALMDSQGDPTSLTARLRFFLPRDVYKLWGPLSELLAADCVPKRRDLRVLDVGAGLGTSTLGLATFAHAHGLCEALHVTAIDSDEQALSLMSRLLSRPCGLDLPMLKLDVLCKRLDSRALSPEGPFDVIICGLSLNEILLPLPSHERPTQGAEFLRALCSRLSPGGVLIALDPALREEARTLSAIRDMLVSRDDSPHVFAPCLGCASCPMLARERDWCHERLPATLPSQLSELSHVAGLRDEELTYSYLTLRMQPRDLAVLACAGQQVYRVVGGPVITKGKREFLLCGARHAPRLLQLQRHRASRADPLDVARRGTVLAVAGETEEQSPNVLRAGPELRVQSLLHWEKRADAAPNPS